MQKKKTMKRIMDAPKSSPKEESKQDKSNSGNKEDLGNPMTESKQKSPKDNSPNSALV